MITKSDRNGRDINEQFVLINDIWEVKGWAGLDVVDGENIWADGENIYYTDTYNHYVFNKDKN